MNNSIYPCLTLKGKAAEAADFYMDIFGEGKIIASSPFVVQIELSGQKLMLLNEGPESLPNPAVSFMVMCESHEQTTQYWMKLLEGGKVMMPLDSYEWSSKYGWIADKYGVSWQLYTVTDNDFSQKYNPTLMFIEENAGKATEAIDFYMKVFPQSGIEGILKYGEGEGDRPDYIKHAQFKIKDYVLMAMDSSAEFGFNFNDAFSLVVECDTQAEIDAYWDELSTAGGREIACGWLQDKYGLSWQIVPRILGKLMSDPERATRVIPVMMQMKKLIISDLEQA
ncbi:VOC family protein [Pedobacter sp. AW31-3R]|uniref:VOC family protein n=1 Tax=Pedobacter sp. AW31-3R TaxID=3445781 RepID=UPI003FA05192